MLFQSFLLLVLAIAIHRLGRSLSDEVLQIVCILISQLAVFLSLVLAPWTIKFMIVIALLVMPIRMQSRTTNMEPI